MITVFMFWADSVDLPSSIATALPGFEMIASYDYANRP